METNHGFVIQTHAGFVHKDIDKTTNFTLDLDEACLFEDAHAARVFIQVRRLSDVKAKFYRITKNMESTEKEYGRVTIADVGDAIQHLKILSEQHGISLDQTIAIATLLEKARTNDIAIATKPE